MAWKRQGLLRIQTFLDMDHSLKIKELKEHIDNLKEIKKTLYTLEEFIVKTEQEIGAIDESLPTEDQVLAMPGGVEREQILHLFDLIDQAYSIVDELLGPPENEPGPAESPSRPQFVPGKKYHTN